MDAAATAGTGYVGQAHRPTGWESGAHLSGCECFSAALLMFLEADPKSQGEFMKRILDAELNEEVEATVAMALEQQAKRIRSRTRRRADEA